MKALRRHTYRGTSPGSLPRHNQHTQAMGTGSYTTQSTNGTHAPNASQPRKLTQEDQDKIDDSKRRDAMKDLMESWMDRLQLISVITTFFASTEAGLLQVTTNGLQSGQPLSAIQQAANSCLVGALVIHSNAAIISFLAAFFLVRYKLKVAKTEEREAEQKPTTKSPTAFTPDDAANVNGEKHPSPGKGTGSTNDDLQLHTSLPTDGPIYSSYPHLVQVGPFQRNPPTHLLARCHLLCVLLAALGFILALAGIVCMGWTMNPSSVGIVGSVCMGFCIILGVITVFTPDIAEGSPRSLIYYHDSSSNSL